MATRSVNDIEGEICPEVELLNQACLDLVAQIEELKRENTWLKKLIREGNGSGVRSGLSENSR